MANNIVVNGQFNAISSRQFLAGQNSYFGVTNPTIGTAVLSAVATSFSATANGLFVIQNKNPAGGRSIYLDYLKLNMSGTAPTATTSMHFDYHTETGLVTGTGNVATATVKSYNTGASVGISGAQVQTFAAGQITIPAAVGTRLDLGTTYLPTSLGITGDTYMIEFGADGPISGGGGGTAVRATAAATIVGQGPAICIAPQTTAWINMFWLTQATNAGSYEFELTWAEL